MSATRRYVAVGVAVAAVAVGCGSSGASNSGIQTLLAGTTSALDTAHTFRITLDGTGSKNGKSESLHGEGVVDWSAGAVDLQITGAETERIVLLPGAAYVQGTLSSQEMQRTHKSWLKLPGGNPSGRVLGGLDPIGDPLTTLSSLRSQLSDVTSEGETQLDGVATTELRGSLATFGNLEHGSATLTAWIDEQGRVRQLHIVAIGNGEADITEHFSDFGLPVQIVAPPPDQVIDFEKLLSRQFSKIPPSDFPTPPPGALPPGIKPPTLSGLPSPTGGWTRRASDVTDGIAWQLSTTTGTHDGECLATVTTPALGQISVDRAADGSGTSASSAAAVYRGLPANCGPATKLDPSDGSAPVVQVLDAESIDQAGSGRHYISGIANPQVRSLAAKLSDGTTATVELDDGVFFATWTGHRRLAGMTFNYPPDPTVTCTSDTGDGYDVSDLTCY